MKLITWLKVRKIKISKFAGIIGISRSAVHKYIYEDAIPQRKVMVKIYRVSLGAVSANDFYKLSDEIFDIIK